MRLRCLCKTRPDYKHYGGRGIIIDKRWDDFWTFVEDMGPRPNGYTVERIDNYGPYSKENCKWASRLEQAKNRRRANINTPNGVTFSKKTGKWQAVVPKSMLGYRKYIGLFTTPQEAGRAVVEFIDTKIKEAEIFTVSLYSWRYQ